MRVALLYPPPWKMSGPGQPAYATDGPPAEFEAGDLDGDFFQTPYGLLSLGAQARRAGHQVKLFNLSGYAWSEAESVVRSLDAEVFGLSCWTANRRGVALTADAIRRHHPNAHIIVGGPHATPLARELLEHHAAIDTVATGESELTFMELLERLSNSESVRGIAGTFYRHDGTIVEGPKRAQVRELDALASPHDYFTTHLMMTSRGCPWQCTFCGAETTWGRGFRGLSVPAVLDALERQLEELPVRIVLVKDDTFTTNKKRVQELCAGIRERNLRFLWSCDTRVDVLNEDLLRAMRLAGCERLSLGVESGSPTVLSNIHKRITTDQIVDATRMAKKFGISVRYFMMLGNRGETRETLAETLAFLERARPHQYVFSCLSIYPGTDDFVDAEREWLDREVYFTGDFQELKTPFDADADTTAYFAAWFAENKGLITLHRPSVEECAAVLSELGDHHAAHLDLAGALFAGNDLAQAEHHAHRALDLGHPLPGVVRNLLACIAGRRGQFDTVREQLERAAKDDPQHRVLVSNVASFRRWQAAGGTTSGAELVLDPRHDFQLLERTQQPALPGPLPADYAQWEAADPPATSASKPGTRRLHVLG